MTDFTKLFEDMMKQGQDMAQKFSPGSTADMFDPANLDKIMPGMSKTFLDAMFGNSVNKEGLDARTRFLVVIAALTAQGATQVAQIKVAVQSALAAGATQQDIIETIMTTGMYGGVPASTAAVQAAQEVFAAKEDAE